MFLSTHLRISQLIAHQMSLAVADPGFPRGGGANSPGVAPTYEFAKFSQNCMKLKEFGPPGGARVPRVPP